MRKRRTQRRLADCEHRETVRTVFAGIERLICESCGHVSVGHHHDFVLHATRGGRKVVRSIP